jgi:vitamin B12 transporter
MSNRVVLVVAITVAMTSGAGAEPAGDKSPKKTSKITSRRGLTPSKQAPKSARAPTSARASKRDSGYHGETVVRGKRVAMTRPSPTYSQLGSELRYQPLVDLQSRNLAESQADVAIRGGIFDNTGVKLGPVSLYDPQTGHYALEIPIPPTMLGRPRVLTGAENALEGFNSSVGALAFELKRISKNRARVWLGVGSYGHHHQQLYLARMLTREKWRLAFDADLAHSAADGTIAQGDHRFFRAAGRLQLRSPLGRTDLLVAYQRKFFGWPYLYALRRLHDIVGSSGGETELLTTTVLLLSHRVGYRSGFFEIGAVYRRHDDDYEFDRTQPGLFNAFKHRTDVGAVGLRGEQRLGGFELRYAAQGMLDRLRSSALTFGTFTHRTYFKAAAIAGYRQRLSSRWSLRAGAGVAAEATDQDGAAASPIAELEVRWRGSGSDRARIYAEYSHATQLPGYTALASNPDSGLFRGNGALGRQRSRNLEGGFSLATTRLRLSIAGFYRQDRQITDWTIVSTLQRKAENVDLDTIGAELVLQLRLSYLRLTVSYQWLDKLNEKGGVVLDPITTAPASFYAFNYAQHRWTLGLLLRLHRRLLLAMDNEFRIQAPNALRKGPQEAAISTLSLSYLLLGNERSRRVGKRSQSGALRVQLIVDNLFDSPFQEVPGVPAARRQFFGALSGDF